MRFLKVTLNPESSDDLDAIVDGLRTTIDRELIVDSVGATFIEILNDTELMEECLCLGICYGELEADGMQDPFDVELCIMEVPPTSAVNVMSLQ
jgi:hypothetical protein